MKERNSQNPEQIIIEGVKSGIDVTQALFTPIAKPLREMALYAVSRAIQKRLRK